MSYRVLSLLLQASRRRLLPPLASSLRGGERIVIRAGGVGVRWNFSTASSAASAAADDTDGGARRVRHEFQAETKKLLEIVANSLYSEREVFLRELICNASDACEKERSIRVSTTSSTSSPSLPPLEIHVHTNPQEATITIEDSGIGMSGQEMVDNLGTIARSGTKAFVETLSDKDTARSLVGQFGVGFYSAFMVSRSLSVSSRRRLAGDAGHLWTSDGSGYFELTPVEVATPGTRVKIDLRPEHREFSHESRVKEILIKYSNFISTPIFLNGTRINTLPALWTLPAREVGVTQHSELYHFLTKGEKRGEEGPLFTLHYHTEAPLNISAILYTPSHRPSIFGVERETRGDAGGGGLCLYSRRVLIHSASNAVLPRWLRFIHGVVESEDVPLNLSRELLQESALVRRVGSLLERRYIRHLSERMRRDAETFDRFFAEFGIFIREGIITATEPDIKEEMGGLLRCESSALPAGSLTSLGQLLERRGERRGETRGEGETQGEREGDNLYYLCAPNRELAMSSPYYEALTSKGDTEVLFCYDPYDELTLLHLGSYKGHRLLSVETDLVVDHYKQESHPRSHVPESLSEDVSRELIGWLRGILGNRISDIRVTLRLSSHPAMVTLLEMGAARHLLRTHNLLQQTGNSSNTGNASSPATGGQTGTPGIQPVLEINPGHPLVRSLNLLRESDPELGSLLAEQIYDNAMIAAGLSDDSRSMVNRLTQLLTRVLTPPTTT